MQKRFMNVFFIAVFGVLFSCALALAQQAPASAYGEAGQKAIDPQAWRELFENRSGEIMNEEGDREARERLRLEFEREAREIPDPAIKKVKDEDEIPVPIRSMTGRREKQLYKQRADEKKEKVKLGIVSDKEEKPMVRGNARILRRERVNRIEKIQEVEEKKQR